MESKISIETNDNFLNFLILVLSEFESKKIQEDLDKAKKIDSNHYTKKLEIESLRSVIKSYKDEKRDKENTIEKLLVLTPGNPDVVFSLCIECYRLDLDMEIVIEDFCLAQNMLVVEVFNSIFEKMKFKRRIKLINNIPDKDIIHESIKFDKTIVVGNSNLYNRLENEMKISFYPYGIFEIYSDTEEFDELKEKIYSILDENMFEVEEYDDVVKEKVIDNLNKTSYKFCTLILTKDKEFEKKAKESLDSEFVIVNKNPFKEIKFKLNV